MRLTILFFLFLFFLSLSYSFSIPWKLMQLSATKFVKKHALDKDCASDLESLILASSNFEPWALKMLDASSKIYPGMMNGHFNLMGDHDQCLSVEENINGRNVIGQYCTVMFGIDILSIAPPSVSKKVLATIQLVTKLENNSVPLAVGICIPKSCSIKNLDNLIEPLEESLKLAKHLPMVEELCVYKNKPVEYTGLDICIFCFFTTIVLIVAASTIYDIFLRLSGQNANILVSFSAYTNGQKLFSYGTTDENTLGCLDGLKVINTFWVLLCHITRTLGILSNNTLFFFNEWRYNPFNAIFWSGFYAVGSFFTISGLLATYSYSRIAKSSSIGFFSFYWLRFLRLTPALLATVFLHTSTLKFLADGSIIYYWSRNMTKDCQDRWWTVFFYFVNRMDYKACVQHSWSISVDSQLYLLAPFILFFINKHPKKVIGACLVGMAYSFMITVVKDLGFTVFDADPDFMDYIHMTVLNHLPSWILGVFFGYLLQQKKVKITPFYNVCLWIFSFCVMITLVIGQTNFFYGELNVYHSALWNSLSRPAWSLALCLMILSCATGNGGFINNFLSHPIFKILNKLSYGIYLLHEGILTNYFRNKKSSFHYDSFEIICHFIIVSILSIISSIPLYLGFEAPVLAWKSFRKNSDERNTKHKIS